MKKKLCDEGQQLWDAIDPRKINSYDNYRRHIIQCSRCKFGLDLERKDILRIRDDIIGGEKNKNDNKRKRSQRDT